MEGLILIIAFFACFAVVGFSALLSDKLAKVLHDKYPFEWEKEGKPYFNGAKDADLLGFATNRFRRKLFWETPKWAVNDREARKLISQIRWAGFIGIIIGVVPFLIAALIMLLY